MKIRAAFNPGNCFAKRKDIRRKDIRVHFLGVLLLVLTLVFEVSYCVTATCSYNIDIQSVQYHLLLAHI